MQNPWRAWVPTPVASRSRLQSRPRGRARLHHGHDPSMHMEHGSCPASPPPHRRRQHATPTQHPVWVHSRLPTILTSNLLTSTSHTTNRRNVYISETKARRRQCHSREWRPAHPSAVAIVSPPRAWPQLASSALTLGLWRSHRPLLSCQPPPEMQRQRQRQQEPLKQRPKLKQQHQQQ